MPSAVESELEAQAPRAGWTERARRNNAPGIDAATPSDRPAVDEALQQDAQAYTRELQRGRRLSFSRDIEEQFQIETCADHWKRILICTLIGHASIWLNAVIEQQVLPEIGPRLLLIWASVSLTALVLLGGCAWLVPREKARAWHIDLAALTPAFMTSLVDLWPSTISSTYPATMHSAGTILIVLWSCILARQRFWFAAALSLLTFAAAVLATNGPTPEQQQIALSNLKSLAITVVFALTANYALEYHQRRTYLLRKLEEAQRAALTLAAQRLRELSIHDPLTGIYNRRHFDQQVLHAWAQASLARLPLAMVMVDVDFFKRFNDSYGHPLGDACLKQVAQALDRVAASTGGCAARLGGEEFGLLLPHRDREGALHVARRLCHEVAALGIAHAASAAAPHVTVSAGVAACVPPQGWADDEAGIAILQEVADAALYEAKQSGRNAACGKDVVLAGAAPAWVADELPLAAVAHESAAHESAAHESAAHESAAHKSAAHAGPTATSLTGVLQSGFRTLRFPADIEARYQDERTGPRRRRLIVSSISGAVLYNAYLWSGRDLIPDIASRLSLAHAWVTALHVLVIALLWWPAMKREAREGIYAAKIALSVALTLWAFMPTHSLTIYAAYIGLLLIPMCGAVAGRMPFRHACGPTVFTFASFALTASFAGPYHRELLLDAFVMMTVGISFVLLVSYMLEHGERTDYLLRQLEHEQRQALGEVHAELHRLALQDPLTGIANRRCFENEFSRAWAGSLGGEVSMLIVDVDHFKAYNDHYGHPAGDACLKRLASTLDEWAEREGVLAARLGGEEFGLLLPRRGRHDAERLGWQLCESVRTLAIEHHHSPVAPHVTVSVGVATSTAYARTTGRELFAGADAALYTAKATGRDRVCSDERVVVPTVANA